MIRPAILSAAALIGAATVASAQTPMMATHNGSLMEMLPAPGGGLVVQYARPRPDLNGLVMPGTVLVRGHWQGRPPQVFVGEARGVGSSRIASVMSSIACWYLPCLV